MFERILVATDLTLSSDAALRVAFRLAKTERALVTVLHVNERAHEGGRWLVPFFEEELKLYSAAIKREDEAARKLIVATIERIGGDATPETLVAPGRAAETIVRVASERGADLIVVGTHGRVGTLGSVAEHVVRTAGRPVLVVPSQGGRT